MKPGRQYESPAQRLRDAAVMFAVAVECEDRVAIPREWDRLRKAAKAYRDGPRPVGRPASRSSVAGGREG